jgi:4-hydroxythreonine-4-phosphate dehydrogenase
MGEPAGIGGEIAMRAWLRRAEGVPVFFAIDDAERLRTLAEDLNLVVPVRTVETPQQVRAMFAHALPVLHRPLAHRATAGKPDVANAAAVLGAIETAVDLAKRGAVRAIVTNPIQKKILYDAGFAFAGHTEYLASLDGADRRPVMMLTCPALRVVPVTVHLRLKDAVATLDTSTIAAVMVITDAALRRDFGVAKPRLAVAGLNPHAGEGGALGDEEQRIIEPAVRAMRARGIDAFGPLPPDTMFSAGVRAGFDAAICMYHDQALIPIKALDFDGGVNTTLGLSFVRTSPDHGTALDLAGSGSARPDSLMAALRLASDMAAQRASTTQPA